MVFFFLYPLVTTLSPRNSRRTFGCLSKSFEPAPIPTCRIVKFGALPSTDEGYFGDIVSARKRAAPVGVTSSPVTPGGPYHFGDRC